MQVKEERDSELVDLDQEQENSAALQWDDAEAEHVMEVAQIKNEEIDEDDPASGGMDADEESAQIHEGSYHSDDGVQLETGYSPFTSSSYHSGDTDHYELDHRPWEDRPAIKRDIWGIIETMVDIDLESMYKIVDRLGEGMSQRE